MLKKILFYSLISIMSITSAFAESATPINFKQNPKSPEYSLAVSFFGGYVKSHPGTKLKTAAIDLNNDGIGEVAVQIVGPGTCNVYGCQTSILMHIGNSWKEIFHQKVKQLGYAKASGHNMARLIDNSGIIWTYKLSDYQPDVSYMGNVVNGSFKSPLDSDVDAVTQYYDNHRMNWNAQVINNSLPGTYLLTSNDPYVNGVSQGTLMVMNNGNILLTDLGNEVVVSENKTNNVNDLIVSLNEGVEFFQWTGHTYKSVRTTFPSSVTPAP